MSKTQLHPLPGGPNSTPLRIAIAGGGTGGHVLPALSVVEVLRGRGTPVEYLWIGSHGGVEVQAARDAGIPFRAVQTGKLRRYLDLQNLLDSARIPVGVSQAWWILRAFRPDVIFSTGGFVSVPAVFAGSSLAPVVTHEQTASLGLATRINLRRATMLALSYDRSRAQVNGYRGRVVVTGNPVRNSLHQGSATRGRERYGFTEALPLLYVTGGARGATPINQRVSSLLPGLLETTQILHQTGTVGANDDGEQLRQQAQHWPAGLQQRYRVVDFVREELADVYAAADLVLGRAGAGTVAELAFLGKPSMLIPLPGSGANEQLANATILEDAGAAMVLDQESATPDRLEREITELLGDPERLRRMGVAARSAAMPNAASDLADMLVELAGRR